jgi:hypothetical protein
MLIVLLVVVAIGTLWDAFTTIYGSTLILGNGLAPALAALIFTALMLGFLLATMRIFRWQGGFSGVLLKFFWFVALAYDFYASWVGNRDLIVGQNNVPTSAQSFMIVGFTLLVISSPVLLSILWDRRTQASEAQAEKD